MNQQNYEFFFCWIPNACPLMHISSPLVFNKVVNSLIWLKFHCCKLYIDSSRKCHMSILDRKNLKSIYPNLSGPQLIPRSLLFFQTPNDLLPISVLPQQWYCLLFKSLSLPWPLIREIQSLSSEHSQRFSNKQKQLIILSSSGCLIIKFCSAFYGLVNDWK